MHEPYLVLYVDGDTLHFAKKLPSESEPRGIIEVPVEQVVADEFDEASKKLGNTVLGILKLWHNRTFQNWGKGSQSGDGPINDFAVAMSLIDRFSDGTTKNRLELVDEILKDASVMNVDAENFLNNDWPALRKRLEAKGAGSN